jgi:hypothetical protein
VRAGGTGPVVAGAVYQPFDAVEHNRARAHRAGFLGDVERAVRQAPIPHGLLGLGQRQHFGVGGGVLEQFHLVEGPGDDASFAHDYRAHRNLLRSVSALGLA